MVQFSNEGLEFFVCDFFPLLHAVADFVGPSYYLLGVEEDGKEARVYEPVQEHNGLFHSSFCQHFPD